MEHISLEKVLSSIVHNQYQTCTDSTHELFHTLYNYRLSLHVNEISKGKGLHTLYKLVTRDTMSEDLLPVSCG